LVKLI